MLKGLSNSVKSSKIYQVVLLDGLVCQAKTSRELFFTRELCYFQYHRNSQAL